MSQLLKRKSKAPERFEVMEKGSFSVDYQKKKYKDESLQKMMYQDNYKEATKAMAELDDKKEVKVQKAGKQIRKAKSDKKITGGKDSNTENQKDKEKDQKLAMRTQNLKEYQKNYREKA